MRRPLTRRILIALVGALALASCQRPPAPSGPAGEIAFSVLSVENAETQAELWSPLFADMEKETGLKIRPFFAANYTAIVEAMRFGKVQAGWFSNQSGLEAVRRGGGEVFARSTDPSGVDGYFSVVIAKADSPLTLDRLLACDRSLSFGLGDAKSTSGTLAPMAFLFAPRGIDPQACFKVVRSANHQANLFAAANGVLDAATNNSTALRLLKENNPALAAKIKVLWTSPRLPEDPIVWRKDLDPAAKEKIRSFFLTYGRAPGAEGERQRKILAALSFGGFMPATDAHLLPVRRMEATEQLLAARNTNDAAGVAAAEASLETISREEAAMGAAAP